VNQANSKIKKFKMWLRTPRVFRWLIVTVIILFLLRLALPFIVKDYVNHQLNKAGDYTGKIGDVTISLWRGAYQIKDINIFKRNGQVRDPFFSSTLLDLSVQWKELFHGAVVGEIEMQNPKINFVSGPTKEQSQAGEDVPWNQTLESLFPFQLNRFEIKNGQIHFQNHFSTPPVDIYVTELSATATNLTNARNSKQTLPAGIVANAKTLGHGELSFGLHFNPVAPAPQFEVTASITNVDLTQLNDFMKAYGKFDVAHGNFALFASVAARDESYEGYLKVFFDHLDVFDWEKERKKNVLQIFWEAIVGGVTTILKNHPQDQLATKVPIAGSYNNSKVGIWTAVANLLENAFIRALVPKLDQRVTVGEVPVKTKEEKIPFSEVTKTNGAPETNGAPSKTVK
jgi:hypothetical protein